MTTQRRIDANRKNAQKSTGPRTAEGKEAVRLNALTHGLSAQTVVLPHEDAGAYQDRLDSWTREMAPRGQVARYLVERMARISWQLDRADGHERARLAKRVREAPAVEARSRGGGVRRLLQRLVSPAEPDEPKRRGPINPFTRLPMADAPRQRGEDPSALVPRIEGSAEGCRRLLAEWADLGQSLERAERPRDFASGLEGLELFDGDRALRLLGLRREDAPALAALDGRVAAIMLLAKCAEDELSDCLDAMDDAEDEDDDEPFPIAPGTKAEADPKVEAKARATVRAVIAGQRSRLGDLLECRELAEAPDQVELCHRAAFDDSREGERLHRYQATWTRALLRTLGMLRKLGDTEDEQAEASPSVAVVDPPGRDAHEEACIQPSEGPPEDDQQNQQIKPIEKRSSSCIKVRYVRTSEVETSDAELVDSMPGDDLASECRAVSVTNGRRIRPSRSAPRLQAEPLRPDADRVDSGASADS